VKTSLLPTPPIIRDAGEFFAQVPASSTAHFINPHDPDSLVRSDSYISEWRGGQLFHQPTSHVQGLPSSLISGYTEDEPPHRPRLTLKKSTKRAKHRSRSRSRDKKKHWGSEWSIEPAEQGNGGLTNAVRAAARGGTIDDVIWVGTVGFPTDSLDEHTKDDITEKLESEYDALTVNVSDSDFDGHYTHYCKTILWPVFHYQIPDHPKSKAYEDHSWIHYVNVNQAFADKIVKSYKRGDIIWIHDYHLLLVPAMIRKKLPDVPIGFFLHSAFPSSEVFRCLSFRKELLEGMLGADLIAFQTLEYQEHFITTCSRLLIVEATPDGVQLDGHFVNVVWHPIGIDPKALNLAREETEVKEWIRVIQARYKGKRLIVARDKLDSIRGIREKLLAFELFLSKYPEWREKIVLIQIATASADDSELSATVADIVTRIDSQYSTIGHQPLVFLRQDISFAQYIALLSVADALMITSLREGMNLSCHEWIVCQDGKLSDKKHGPVILSEFTGSATVFKGAELSINPWDYRNCADAIKLILEMDHAEKHRRYKLMRDIVYQNTGEFWINALVRNLAKVHEEHYKHDNMSIPRLNVNQLSAKYREASSRVFTLDYEGTMANSSIPQNIHLGSPQRVIDALNDLLIDDRNIVYIMSGRMPEELERTFSLVPNIGIIAENGCYIRKFGCDEWTEFADLDKLSKWKHDVRSILLHYKLRIEGSEVEQRHCSLIFHYGKANDKETAVRIAGECINHINDVFKTQNVHAVPTENAVVVEALEWSKASAATHLFEGLLLKADEGKRVDFLLVAGDDREDEAIFHWANGLGKKGVVRDVTTISVGKRNTEAMATLTQGTTGLVSVLKKLAKLRWTSAED
jgi:HAD superfamily hydrolase (TIGR01484 family)